MKEFIDKLIERLEEEQEYQYKKSAEADVIEEIDVKTARIKMGDCYYHAIEIINELAEENNMGEISDGYHTFNELYHHRAVLFSVICNSNKEKAWKSKLHDTGDMYEGMFIVGIETPEGQATYHYDINPYWDMFKVKELPKAPKWDGHTPNEAIRRIGLLAEEYINTSTISKMENVGWIPCERELPKMGQMCLCSVNTEKYKAQHPIVICEYREPYINRWADWYTAWMPLPTPYEKAGD